MLLHLALASDWEAALAAGRYGMSTRGMTIEQVGYLHCCRDEDQLAGVRERFYADVTEPLVVLVLGDVGEYGLRIVDEPPAPGVEETFPHVYGGPLPVEAVIDVRPVGEPAVAALADLHEAVGSPYPSVRDGWAYAQLAGGIRDGRFTDDELAWLEEATVARLADERVQARCFAPLVLSWLVSAGRREGGWFADVRLWYLGEKDTRGYDERLGWLHAVAHGADLLGDCARFEMAAAAEVLEVLARRVVADDGPWVAQEDARVAHAMIAALAAAGADELAATGWLAVARDRLGEYEAAPQLPLPVWLANLTSTLALLALALDAGPVAFGEPVDVECAAAVRREIAAVQARMTPWLLRLADAQQP